MKKPKCPNGCCNKKRSEIDILCRKFYIKGDGTIRFILGDGDVHTKWFDVSMGKEGKMKKLRITGGYYFHVIPKASNSIELVYPK